MNGDISSAGSKASKPPHWQGYQLAFRKLKNQLVATNAALQRQEDEIELSQQRTNSWTCLDPQAIKQTPTTTTNASPTKEVTPPPSNNNLPSELSQQMKKNRTMAPTNGTNEQ